MPQKAADIWCKFDKISQPAKSQRGVDIFVKRARCHKCKCVMNRNLTTVVPHYKTCTGDEDAFDDKGMFKRAPTSNDTSTMYIEEKEEEYIRKFKQSTITNSLAKLSKQGKEMVTTFFGLWIAEKTLDFKVFESVYFKAAIHILNCNYKVPNHKNWRDDILPAIRNDIKGMVDEDLKLAASAMVGIDGSSDRQEGVNHVLAFIPEPRLLMIKRSKEKKETAEVLYGYCEDGVEYMKEQDCEETGLMADNCSTMKAVGNKWREERNTGAPGCGTHGMSLTNQKILTLPRIKV